MKIKIILEDIYYRLLYNIPDDFVNNIYKIINNIDVDETLSLKEQNIPIEDTITYIFSLEWRKKYYLKNNFK